VLKKPIVFILLILILGICSNIYAQKERFLLPVDEGKRDESFNIFRENLINAVKRKDKNHLIGVLDPNISLSFGGDAGIKDFKKYWEIDKSTTKIWDELLPVLTNGGKFSYDGGKKIFCAPYSFTDFPDDLDAFEYQVIFGNNVRLRLRPDLSSRILTKLSYNIVKIDYEQSITDGNDEPNYIWYKIETLGGMKGFVSADYVRSPIDYRACFAKKGGKWKMTDFIAGD
jgi:hypothetical protein